MNLSSWMVILRASFNVNRWSKASGLSLLPKSFLAGSNLAPSGVAFPWIKLDSYCELVNFLGLNFRAV